MNKRTVQSWVKKIKKQQEDVAKKRDNIDDMISELSDLREVCDKAYDSLQDARDALSELV